VLDIFASYFVPFVFGMTVVLLITALVGWSDIPNYMLVQGWWLWLAITLSGAVTLIAGLSLGLSSYGLAGYLLNSQTGSLVEDMTSQTGLVKLTALVLLTNAGASIFAAAAGATQWVIFRRFLPRISSTRWIVMNIVIWPGGFLACLCFSLSLGALTPSAEPVILMVSASVVPGVTMGWWLGQLAQEARQPLTPKAIASQIANATSGGEYEAKQATKTLAQGNQLGAEVHGRIAIRQFTLALDLDPSHAGAHYGRALVYEMLGDRPRAIEDLQHTIALASGDTLKRMAQDRLAQLDGK
jgi:hypothetical protein